MSFYFNRKIVWDVLDPKASRLAFPTAAVLALVAWETRWDGFYREERHQHHRHGTSFSAGQLADSMAAKISSGAEAPDDVDPASSVDALNRYHPLNAHKNGAGVGSSATPASVRYGTPTTARLEIFNAEGIAPVLVKLGEYAMCRQAWIESYYWMSLAKLRGVMSLEIVLLKIRRNWARSGFPEEYDNISEIFSEDDASIGRALIHLSSGRDAAAAHEFLQTKHPEFL